MNYTVKLQRCRYRDGERCFAYANGSCKCLSDTRTVPCPFFKTKEQVIKEDPEYFTRGK